MRVQVRLAGHLSRDGRSRNVTVEVDSGATVADLIATLGIPSGEVGTVYLDGKGAFHNAFLHEDSRVELFPPIAGG